MPMQAAHTRWMVSGAASVAVMATLLALFRFSGPSTAPLTAKQRLEPPSKPLVQMRDTATDTALKEEAEVRDLRPLFLPTEFNVSLPEPRRDPGRTFLDNETLKWSFSESELNLRELPGIETLNGKPAVEVKSIDAVEAGREGPGLAGMGRNPVEIGPLSPSGGRLEVVSAGAGASVLTDLLPVDARPKGEKPWEPLELIAMVDSTGLSAPLTVTMSSRVEEIDAHYRNYLAQRYRIGDRLPPGFYRLIVAP